MTKPDDNDMSPGQAIVILCISAAVAFFLIAIWVQTGASMTNKFGQTGGVFAGVGVLVGMARLVRGGS